MVQLYTLNHSPSVAPTLNSTSKIHLLYFIHVYQCFLLHHSWVAQTAHRTSSYQSAGVIPCFLFLCIHATEHHLAVSGEGSTVGQMWRQDLRPITMLVHWKLGSASCPAPHPLLMSLTLSSAHGHAFHLAQKSKLLGTSFLNVPPAVSLSELVLPSAVP